MFFLSFVCLFVCSLFCIYFRNKHNINTLMYIECFDRFDKFRLFEIDNEL